MLWQLSIVFFIRIVYNIQDINIFWALAFIFLFKIPNTQIRRYIPVIDIVNNVMKNNNKVKKTIVEKYWTYCQKCISKLQKFNFQRFLFLSIHYVLLSENPIFVLYPNNLLFQHFHNGRHWNPHIGSNHQSNIFHGWIN